MSLWPVADEATASIMVDYYKYLSKGMNKGEALRAAKLAFMETQPKAKQHPYYWAAFVHLGDFSTIQTSDRDVMIFWLMAGGAILFFGFFFRKRR